LRSKQLIDTLGDDIIATVDPANPRDLNSSAAQMSQMGAQITQMCPICDICAVEQFLRRYSLNDETFYTGLERYRVKVEEKTDTYAG
jgi:hypothetical protein